MWRQKDKDHAKWEECLTFFVVCSQEMIKGNNVKKREPAYEAAHSAKDCEGDDSPFYRQQSLNSTHSHLHLHLGGVQYSCSHKKSWWLNSDDTSIINLQSNLLSVQETEPQAPAQRYVLGALCNWLISQQLAYIIFHIWRKSSLATTKSWCQSGDGDVLSILQNSSLVLIGGASCFQLKRTSFVLEPDDPIAPFTPALWSHAVTFINLDTAPPENFVGSQRGANKGEVHNINGWWQPKAVRQHAASFCLVGVLMALEGFHFSHCVRFIWQACLCRWA